MRRCTTVPVGAVILEVMSNPNAKNAPRDTKNAESGKAKRPGRIAQMREVYRQTKEHDRNLPYMMLLAFIVPVGLGLLVALLLPGNWLSWVLWGLTGLLVGLLLALIILGRRAERSAYQQIEGRQGAVGAVVSSGLRGSYRGSEMPVAITPRGGDAVYRVIGKGGVIHVSEGDPQRVRRLVNDENRKVTRILPGVTVTHLHVGRGDGEVPLPDLSRRLRKLPKTLNRAEVNEVYQRLGSLRRDPVGIPKGVDPLRVRKPGRPR